MIKYVITIVIVIVTAGVGIAEGLHLTNSNAIEFGDLVRTRRQLGGSCVLPQQPLHGSYSVVGETEPLLAGTRVKAYTFLEIQCYGSYVLTGSKRIYCAEGKWSEEDVRCSRSCKPLVSASIIYECTQKDVKVPCDKPMAAGTKAFLSCKPNYYAVQLPVDNIFCDGNGNWEQTSVICMPECGTPSKGSKFAIKGFKAHLYQFPWHAAIYDKENSTVPNVPDIICGGSIVSSNKVLSAAHCFWDPKEGEPRPVDSFSVGYGKVFSGWKNNSDVYAGYSDVKRIIVHSEYQDLLQSYAQDIAIVVLTNIIEFNQIIRPVCIDWGYRDDGDSTQAGELGKVPGWGKISEAGDLSTQLMQVSMPVVSKKTCRHKADSDFYGFITADKICAGYGNGSSVCHGDSGGGLVFYEPSREAYYLKGIVSSGPTREEQCDAHAYALFTSVIKHLKFLQDQKTPREADVFQCTSGIRIDQLDKCDGKEDCDDGSDESVELCTTVETMESSELQIGSCILPARPGNGTYAFVGSDVIPQSWTPTAHGTKLKYKCNKNHILTGIDEVTCNEGQWVPALPKCLKPCSSLETQDGTSISCSFNEKNMDCGKPMPPGTRVSVTCYEGPSRGIFQTLTCLDSAVWDNQLLYCFTECGVTYKSFIEKEIQAVARQRILEQYGREWLKQAETPWNAVIYYTDEGETPKPICGGTLVEILSHKTFREILVITDKSCEDNYGIVNVGKLSSVSVGLGKLYQGWQDARDPYAVYAGVKDIRHDGRSGAVVLVLDQLIKDSFLIRPICLRNHANLQEASAEVDGWNFSPNKKQSKQHRAVDIIRPTPLCSDNVKGTKIKIRGGKFCKEHNGVAVFKRFWENFLLRTYLLGLVSGVNSTCEAETAELNVVTNYIPAATVPLDWY